VTDLDLKWVEVNALLQDRFGKVPNMEEEKQDLMHVAMCILLADDGYYEYTHHDADGWPHFNKLRDFPSVMLKEQEDYLKEKVIKYFDL
jgi:hypothetical protein